MWIKDKLEGVGNDLQELGPLEFSKKYKKSLITTGIIGIGSAVYITGNMLNQGPCQEVNQYLEQITDSASLDYQLEMLDKFGKDVGRCFIKLRGREMDLARPEVKEMLEETKEAYRVFENTVKEGDFSQAMNQTAQSQLKETTRSLLDGVKGYFPGVSVPADISEKMLGL